jgi:pilus assembly protein CpaF
MEGEIITLQDIFVYEKTGVDEKGKVLGSHRATGIQPRCLERLKAMGITVLDEYFRN